MTIDKTIIIFQKNRQLFRVFGRNSNKQCDSPKPKNTFYLHFRTTLSRLLPELKCDQPFDFENPIAVGESDGGEKREKT